MSNAQAFFIDQLAKPGLQEAIALKKAILNNTALLSATYQAAQYMVNAYQQGKRVWFCGNGGSAADAQHLAAELSGRYYFDRPPLPAEALHVNTSYLTAVANDYSYDAIYARAVQAHAQSGDVLVAISTSGNSANIVAAAQQAQSMGVQVIAFTGKTGGQLKPLSNVSILIPSTNTPRIQECHILLGHMCCQYIEEVLFGEHK